MFSSALKYDSIKKKFYFPNFPINKVNKMKENMDLERSLSSETQCRVRDSILYVNPFFVGWFTHSASSFISSTHVKLVTFSHFIRFTYGFSPVV